jgi:hypothetical protein
MKRNFIMRRKLAYIVPALCLSVILLVADANMQDIPAPNTLFLETPIPEPISIPEPAVIPESAVMPETVKQPVMPLSADEPAVVPTTEVIEPQKPQLETMPVWMRIPTLSVDAEIQATDPNFDYTMEIVPSASILSWLRTSPIPGNDGNALIAGHNKWGGKRGQLIDLDTLSIGDEMEVEYEDGTCLKFMLESVFVYALATGPADLILDMEGDARVTLITCKEPFNPQTGTSDNRIVAIFKEESVFVIPNPPVTPFPSENP